MSRLNDKVVLVTGAGAGIGRGIAQALAAEGAFVVASSRTAAHAEATAQAICEAGGSAIAVAADVRQKADAEHAVQAALSAGERLDCVVNNAGVNVCSSLLDLPEEAWDRVFDVNVKGVYLVAQAALRHMVPRRQGRIVNIASWAGRNPLPLFVHYAASKAAVIALTRGLALEVAEHGITVNAVLPGNVWSDIWPGVLADYARLTGKREEECLSEFVQGMPFKHMQKVEDVAAAVIFLLSEEAREITGEALGVTGGL